VISWPTSIGSISRWLWREIAITPFADEARWREGCATGEVLSDMMLPLKRGKTVNGREQLLIGGELFELDDSASIAATAWCWPHAGSHPARAEGAGGAEPCAGSRCPSSGVSATSRRRQRRSERARQASPKASKILME
jgi:hypothetical protein